MHNCETLDIIFRHHTLLKLWWSLWPARAALLTGTQWFCTKHVTSFGTKQCDFTAENPITLIITVFSIDITHHYTSFCVLLCYLTFNLLIISKANKKIIFNRYWQELLYSLIAFFSDLWLLRRPHAPYSTWCVTLSSADVGSISIGFSWLLNSY